MVNVDVVVTNLVQAAAFGAGAYLVVEYILPKVRTIAAEVLRYPKTADSLVFLLSVLVYTFAAAGIVEKLVAIGLPWLNYIALLTPLIEVVKDIIPTIKLVLIGIGIVLLAERIRLRA